VFLQVAIYAGLPSANAAFAAAKRVLGDAAASPAAEPGR
jgi:alkylhydroperoxidase/carboxymuconolactone decarboxylase family protein YurZ